MFTNFSGLPTQLEEEPAPGLICASRIGPQKPEHGIKSALQSLGSHGLVEAPSFE